MVKLSVLDLAYIGEGSLQMPWPMRDTAQHAEIAGYNRFWLAEHHNLSGIASGAHPSVSAMLLLAAIRSGRGRWHYAA